MSPEVRRVLDKLDAVKPLGGGWIARCPAHDDERPSLKIDLADDGRVLLNCYAGCKAAAIVAAIGLELADLFPPKDKTERSKRVVKTTTYEVRDKDGTLVAYHVRDDYDDGSKAVRWKRPNGQWGLGGTPLSDLPLYGVEKIGAVDGVVVTEGEKARDALKARKIAAVGTVTGADVIPGDDALRPLLGHLIVLWPDRDGPGEKHMGGVAAKLAALGQPREQIRRVCWADAPPLGDAADWVGERDELVGLIGAAEPWPFGSNGTHDPDDAPREAEADDFHLTDLGNARRLVKAHGDVLRHMRLWERWQVWDGTRWDAHGIDRATEMAKSVVMAMYAELATLSGKERDELYKHAKRSEAAGRIAAMLKLAESDPAIVITPDELDRDPWLLNCANGTVDLQRGEVRTQRRTDLITKIAPVEYDPSATCPHWEAFLSSVFAGDRDLIGFVQRALGYSLTGITRERVVFILYGSGRNGKTTLLEVVQSVLGFDYATTASSDLLMTKRETGIPNDVAALKGLRFVTASESGEGRKFDETKIKQLTGNERLSARHMRGEWFTFQPEFKLWLCTNHKPVIRGTDHAIWDRIRLIPFGVRFWKPGEDAEGPDELRADDGLRERLMGEAPGILAWMAEGCVWWQRDGIGYPKAVKDATGSYRSEMDRFGEFVEDRCLIDEKASVSSAALYAAYRSWAVSLGDEPMTNTAMGIRLRERGFQDGRPNRERGWFGLRLIPDGERVEETNRRYGL